jgi:UDP-N-acetylglucosamine 2-epimerase (non-hydrolysing)
MIEMKAPLKLLLVAGARPNFMKIAPLIRAMQRHGKRAGQAGALQYSLVHTGQHYDARMSQVFFDEMGLPAPRANLGVGSGSHAAQTARIMLGFEPVCVEVNPDWVVVVGDVNSTMACTLVAAKLGVKVAHVEAGLRSFDRGMPEEINRVVTDAVADLLFTPSEDASENLRREGVAEAKIRFVGNIMIDALLASLPQVRRSTVLGKLGVEKKAFAYVTLHRPANVDQPTTLARILEELERLATLMPVVFPLHPRTRKMIAASGKDLAKSGLRVLDPVGYHDSLALTEAARLVVTDSGGLQEESTFFGTPCLTLRPNTERPVTIHVGTNRLSSPERLWHDVQEALARKGPAGHIPKLWDGGAAERILGVLLERSRGGLSPNLTDEAPVQAPAHRGQALKPELIQS